MTKYKYNIGQLVELHSGVRLFVYERTTHSRYGPWYQLSTSKDTRCPVGMDRPEHELIPVPTDNVNVLQKEAISKVAEQTVEYMLKEILKIQEEG